MKWTNPWHQKNLDDSWNPFPCHLHNERSRQVDACPSKRCSFQVKTRIANAVIMNKVVHVIDSALCICVLAFHFFVSLAVQSIGRSLCEWMTSFFSWNRKSKDSFRLDWFLFISFLRSVEYLKIFLNLEKKEEKFIFAFIVKQTKIPTASSGSPFWLATRRNQKKSS